MYQRSSCLLKLVNTSPYKLVFCENDDELLEINADVGENDRPLDQSSDLEMYGSFEQLTERTQFDHNNNRLNSPLHAKRKRRQLPKIPENKKPLVSLIGSSPKKNKVVRQISSTLSLQIELDDQKKPVSLQLINTDPEQCDLHNQSGDSLKPLDEMIDYRPLSEQLNSTANSDDFSGSLIANCSTISGNRIEGNYRGLHRFIARHEDEISIDIGDSIFVIKQEDDLWFKGINLATNSTGYFPSLYVIDCNYKELFQTVNYFGSADDDSGLNCECTNEFDCAGWIDTGKQAFQMQATERFALESLGSLEVARPAGNQVLEQSIHKVIRTYIAQAAHQTTGQPALSSFMCILEISERGLRFYNRQNQLNGSPSRTNQSLSECVQERTKAIEQKAESVQEDGPEECDEDKEKSGRSIEDLMRGYVQIKFREEKEREIREQEMREQKMREKREAKDHRSHEEKVEQNKAPVLEEKPSPCRLKSESSQNPQLSQATKEPTTAKQDDFFFHLKHITYCGSELGYFAFVSQHPQLKSKYACHVFNAHRPQVAKDICESIGKAFQRFYLNYIELSQNFVD